MVNCGAGWHPAKSVGRSIRFPNIIALLLWSSLIAGCSTGKPQTTFQVIPVYSTFAAEPWLTELYDCASGTPGIVLSRLDDPNAADISLRIGEPTTLSSFAYQIDEEEILIVTHRQSPIQNLTRDQAQALFMGLGNTSVEVWVYSPDADVQEQFDRVVMQGRVITPSAFVAATPQRMSDTLVNEPNTVGILPRHWKAGDVRDVFSVATVPVLALTHEEPEGVIRQLIGCLQ